MTGLILEVNPYLCDLLGYPSAEIVGLRLWEIDTFVDKGKLLQDFSDLQDKLYVHYGRMPLLTKAEKSIAVEFFSNVYSIGEAMLIQCNIRDISGGKRAEGLQQGYDNAVLAGLSGIVNALTSVLETRDPYTAGYCGVDLLTGMHAAGKPRIDPAEPPRPVAQQGAPQGATSSLSIALSNSESANNRLRRVFSSSSSYSFGEALRLEALGLCCFHAAV